MFNNSSIRQQLFNDNSKLQTNSLELSLIYKMNNFRFELNSTYLNQDFEQNRNSNFLLSPNLQMTDKNKKWVYSITTSNILHLNKFKYFTNNLGSYRVENSVEYNIPGYILGGVRCNF